MKGCALKSTAQTSETMSDMNYCELPSCNVPCLDWWWTCTAIYAIQLGNWFVVQSSGQAMAAVGNKSVALV